MEIIVAIAAGIALAAACGFRVFLPLTAAANVTVLAELMTGDVTEFSGRIGPIRVVPGAAPTPAP